MKPRRESWLGPLPKWELIRLARRGQLARARFLVLCAVMIAFVAAPVFWFTRFNPTTLFFQHTLNLSIKEVADLSDRLATVMIMTLVFAVAAIAPGYAAAAVAEEKDQYTWASLLSSGLSNREIVVGKAFARVVFMAMAALGAIPVLFATTIFGGVSLEFITAGIVLVFSAIVLAVAVGIHSGCIYPSLRAALMRAYLRAALLIGATTVGFPCCATTFGIVWSFWEFLGMPVPMVFAACTIAAVQTGIANGFMKRAVAVIPNERGDFPVPHPFALHYALPKIESPNVFKKSRPTQSYVREKPTLHDNMDAILWKERFVGRHVEPEFVILFNFLPATFGWVALFSVMSYPPAARLWPTIMLHTLFQWMYSSQTAVALAAAIARERRRKTLDGLLSLPMDRAKLLSTKIAAVLERAWGWLLASVVTGYAAISGFDWPMVVSTTCFIVAGNILLIGWGSWLTVESPSELQVLRRLLPLALIIANVPLIMASFIEPRDYGAYTGWLAGSAVIMAAAGWRFWRRALRRFVQSE